MSNPLANIEVFSGAARDAFGDKIHDQGEARIFFRGQPKHEVTDGSKVPDGGWHVGPFLQIFIQQHHPGGVRLLILSSHSLS
jgi:hypothetical protein